MTDIVYKQIKQKYDLNQEDIYGIYLFGSRVYGTNEYHSDYDYIVINKKINNQEIKHKIVNIHLYTKEQFQKMLNEHKMIVIEVFYIYKMNDFNLNIDKEVLKKEVLKNSDITKEISRKRFLDNDNSSGLNKFFHSIRILDFANQIIEKGKIENYNSMNWLWEEIKYSPLNWEDLNIKYNNLYLEKIKKLN